MKRVDSSEGGMRRQSHSIDEVDHSPPGSRKSSTADEPLPAVDRRKSAPKSPIDPTEKPMPPSGESRHPAAISGARRVEMLKETLALPDREMMAQYNGSRLGGRGPKFGQVLPRTSNSNYESGKPPQPQAPSASTGSPKRSQALPKRMETTELLSRQPSEDIARGVERPLRPATTDPISDKPSYVQTYGPRRTGQLSPLRRGSGSAQRITLPLRPSSASPSPFGTAAFLQPKSRPSTSLPPISGASGVQQTPGEPTIETATPQGNALPGLASPMTAAGMAHQPTNMYSESNAPVGEGLTNESITSIETGMPRMATNASAVTPMSANVEPEEVTPDRRRDSAPSRSFPIVDVDSPHLSLRTKRLLDYYRRRCDAHSVPVNSGVLYVLSTCDEGESGEALTNAGAAGDTPSVKGSRLPSAGTADVAATIEDFLANAEGYEVVEPFGDDEAPAGEALGFDDCDVEVDRASDAEAEEAMSHPPAMGQAVLSDDEAEDSPTGHLKVDGMGNRASSTASYAFSTPSGSTLFFGESAGVEPQPPAGDRTAAHVAPTSARSIGSASQTTFPHVREANFTMNCLGPQGIRPVFDVLRRCPNLTHLSLRGNNLDNGSVNVLVNDILTVVGKDAHTGRPRRRLMRHRFLRLLDLSDNPLGLLGGKALLSLMDVGHEDIAVPHPPSQRPGSEDSKKAHHRGEEMIEEHFICNVERVVLEDTMLNAALVRKLENKALSNRIRNEGGALQDKAWPELLGGEANSPAPTNSASKAKESATPVKEVEKKGVKVEAATTLKSKADAAPATKEVPKPAPKPAPKPVAQPQGFVLYWEIMF